MESKSEMEMDCKENNVEPQYDDFRSFCGLKRIFIEEEIYELLSSFPVELKSGFDSAFYENGVNHRNEEIQKYQPSKYGQEEFKYVRLENWIKIEVEENEELDAFKVPLEVIGSFLSKTISVDITQKTVIKTPQKLKMVIETDKMLKFVEEPYKEFMSMKPRNFQLIQREREKKSFLVLKPSKSVRISPLLQGDIFQNQIVGWTAITLAEDIEYRNQSNFEYNKSETWYPNSPTMPLIGMFFIFNKEEIKSEFKKDTLVLTVSINEYFGYFNIGDGGSEFGATQFIETDDIYNYQSLARLRSKGYQVHFTLFKDQRNDYLSILDLHTYSEKHMVVQHQFHVKMNTFLQQTMIKSLPSELLRIMNFQKFNSKAITRCKFCDFRHLYSSLCRNPWIDMAYLLNLLLQRLIVLNYQKTAYIFNNLSLTRYHSILESKQKLYIIKVTDYVSEFIYHFGLQGMNLLIEPSIWEYDVLVNYSNLNGVTKIESIHTKPIEVSVSFVEIYDHNFLYVSFPKQVRNRNVGQEINDYYPELNLKMFEYNYSEDMPALECGSGSEDEEMTTKSGQESEEEDQSEMTVESEEEEDEGMIDIGAKEDCIA